VPLTAIFLLLLSASLHASWNFISKRQAATVTFFAVSTLAAGIIFFPSVIFYWDDLKKLSAPFWIFVLVTGFFEMIYFVGLSKAYSLGDMSLAYPLVRALPILLVAGISIALGRGESLSALGLLGMSLVTLGCLILPLQSFTAWQPKNYFNKAMPWILLAATGVTGYTLIDDLALKQVRVFVSVAPSTFIYSSLQGLSTALFIWGYLVLFEQSTPKLTARALPIAALTGLMISATYGLTLTALAFVKDVSYANAFRQLSIPLGAMLGMLIAKEPAYKPKLLGIAIMVLGLILTVLG
jgi:drug/metabolite transporter (DMT)-like permease